MLESAQIERPDMKAIRAALLAALPAACLFAVIGSTPSVAEIYRPWCAQYYGFGGGSSNCGFTSYAQCMQTAGPGTGAWCVQNPWYLAYGAGDTKPDGTGHRTRTRR
jgi:hypothetical protein